MSPLPRRVWIALVLASVVVYVPTLRNGFVWDDRDLVVGNPRIGSWERVGEIFTHTFTLSAAFGGVESKAYRPLFELSLLVDRSLWGLTSFGFHLTNLGLHVVNVVLLFRLMRGFVPSPLATASVLLWAVHPVLTEGISLITGRNHPLFSLLVLAGLLLWRKQPLGWAQVAGAASLMGAALLSHEMAIVFPLLALLVDVASTSRVPGSVWVALRRRWAGYLTLLIVGAAYLGLRLTVVSMGPTLDPGTVMEDLGPRLLLTVRVVAGYVALVAFPLWLSIGRGSDLRFPASPLDDVVLASFGLLAAMAGIAWWLWRRTPLPAYGLLWFAALILPVSNVLPFYAIMAERYLYLASAGVILFGVSSGALLLRSGHRAVSLSATAVVLLLAGLLGVRTVLRNVDYRDDGTLVASSLRATPNSAVLLIGLGAGLRSEGQYAEAVRVYREAIRLKPDSVVAWNDLGVAYGNQGQYAEAVQAFEESIRLKPIYATTWNNLGAAYAHQGLYAEAVQAYREAIRLEPGFAVAWYNLAFAYFRLNKRPQAEQVYQHLKVLDPAQAEALRQLISR